MNKIKKSRAFLMRVCGSRYSFAENAFRKKKKTKRRRLTRNHYMRFVVCVLPVLSTYVGRFCNPCGDTIPKNVPWGTAKPDRISLWRLFVI